MGLREYSDWNVRIDDSSIEPYKKYTFICEVQVTEIAYIKHLIKIQKKLGVHPNIDISVLERTDEDENISAPIRLVKFGKEHKRNENFDKDRDTIIILFDAEVFENKDSKYYNRVLNNGRSEGFEFGVTNPCFELFLLLHYEDGFTQYIKPRLQDFLSSKGLKERLANKILRQVSNINPKKNRNIGVLAESVITAIKEEKNLNQNIDDCKGKVTSNIGSILESILNETDC